MSLFSLQKGTQRTGAIIDIGSGSVSVAIVTSKSHEAEPVIIWSHREHAPLRNIESIEQSAKSVLTALVNALLKFDGEGRRALHNYNRTTKIPEILCCISAPWSYTVTKSINYSQEIPFEITEHLLDELVKTAEKKATLELSENESAANLGLTIVARTTMDLLANGYRVKEPTGQKANDIQLSHASVVIQDYLSKELQKLHDKLFPSSTFKKISHILAFYNISETLVPATFDTCLIDITYEATEIGIVRDGSLRYATHTPFGSFSLAREIAAITAVPLYEAFQHLHSEEPYLFLSTLPENQKVEVEKVFDAYVERLTALFHETGDDLSIPKQILIHADLKSEPLFTTLVGRAAANILKTEAKITMTTPTVLNSAFPSFLKNSSNTEEEIDTSLLLAALFFHKQIPNTSFEYL